MIKKTLNKEVLFKILDLEIIQKNKYTINQLCELWSLHKGTINRWFLKKEVPINYFNHINKILDNKYSFDIAPEQHYKSMDQFFTPSGLAKELINKSIDFITENFNIDLKEYSLIEPSAGSGNFFFNFPHEKFKSIEGLDIEPQNENIKKQDWLTYKPKNNKNIVIGNPPFGLRGQLALQFINKAAEFSDFICFILPPLFNSNGKGSPMLRINKEFYLAKEFKIKDKDFFYPNGKKIKINAIFQIWTKMFTEKVKPILPPKKQSEWVKIYSLSNGKTPSSKRNVNMIGKCDYYLPSTTFQTLTLKRSFDELPHNRGYGIVILKDKKNIKKIIENINWEEVSFKSTNSANNIRIQLIIQAIEERI